jgi:hypothetical protein
MMQRCAMRAISCSCSLEHGPLEQAGVDLARDFTHLPALLRGHAQ